MLIIKHPGDDAALHKLILDQIINCMAARNIANSPAWLGEVDDDGKILSVVRFARIYVCSTKSADIRTYVIAHIENRMKELNIEDSDLQTISGCPTRSIHQYIIQPVERRIMHSNNIYNGIQIRYVGYSSDMETTTTLFVDNNDIIKPEYNMTNVITLADNIFKELNITTDISTKVEQDRVPQMFAWLKPSHIDIFVTMMYKLMAQYHGSFNHNVNNLNNNININKDAGMDYNGTPISLAVIKCTICEDPCFKHRYVQLENNEVTNVVCSFCLEGGNNNKIKILRKQNPQLQCYINTKSYAAMLNDISEQRLDTKLKKSGQMDKFKEIIAIADNGKIDSCSTNGIITTTHVFMPKWTYISNMLQNEHQAYQGKKIFRFEVK